MKRAFLVLPLLPALLSLASPAHAVSFPRADRNGDGSVTYEEAERVFSGLSEVHFLKVDRNGDGVIDMDEFPALNSLYWSLYESSY